MIIPSITMLAFLVFLGVWYIHKTSPPPSAEAHVAFALATLWLLGRALWLTGTMLGRWLVQAF